jgi:threonine dehydrogenase-like Zn-dependent dehydrogenase
MAPISSRPKTMKAVVLKRAGVVAAEEVPIPRLQADTDVLIKVHVAGLCGSDLHYYRGDADDGSFVMGHEVVGTIVEAGSEVKQFQVGDHVISPFSVSCGSCFYCDRGYTSRCTSNFCLTGGQAEYFRLPLADSMLFPFPEGLPEDVALLMTDILPTGYSCAYNARRLLDEDSDAPWSLADLKAGKVPRKGVAVVIGCGPVGLCAISSALTLFETVFATDLNASRLAVAEKHGAVALSSAQLKDAVLAATEGRGADAVLEVVGHGSALNAAFEYVRPYGAVSSVGVHNLKFEIDGDTLYSKNVRMQFGRCSVRTFFPLALDVLKNNLALFTSFVEHKVGLEDAEEYYKLFNEGKINKTVFVMD